VDRLIQSNSTAVPGDRAEDPRRPVHLVVDGVSKSFGGSRALDGVSISVIQGTVHCLIGENGAGKSTLGRVIAGTHRPDAGTLTLLGQPVSFRSPADALAAGVTGMAQEVALVPAMSVADNVLLGMESSALGFVQDRVQRERVERLIQDFGFDLDPGARVDGLRIADQQKVEILKAVARGSQLIVMDEPTASLGDRDALALLALVRRLREAGTTIVYISHHLDEILAVADAVTVLRNGSVVYDGPPLAEQDLVLHMLGRPLEGTFPPKTMPGPDAPVVFSAHGLGRRGAFDGVDLELRAGEVLGIAGLVGSGRTELARVLAGVDRPSVGSVSVAGVRRRFGSPAAAMRAGVHLVPEDRKRQGLVMVRPTRENVTYSVLDRVSAAGFVRRAREHRVAADASSRTDIRTTSIDSPVWMLSGGNQQKVMFARAWLARPSILIVDEPTKGVDIGAKLAIHTLVAELAAGGMGIIVISSEHDEVMGLAHRLLVMSEGRVVAEFEGPEFADDEVKRAVLSAAPRGADADD
jgi:rhamnose transport system ATP-binding protein